ncbi:MAG: hypothetical protein QGF12_09535 [SAR202 cluster bacterium]|nr:hypothetical protein [SAR202 cluster bacterium]
MTWLWKISDMDQRVEWAQQHSPTDVSTWIARQVINYVTLIISYILWPLDYVLRLIGHGLGRLALGLLFLLILTAIWFPIWLTLVMTSRLWLRAAWTRPILLIPGIVVTIFAHIYIMLVPDPQKGTQYVNLVRMWPLSYQIWQPPDSYFEDTGLITR